MSGSDSNVNYVHKDYTLAGFGGLDLVGAAVGLAGAGLAVGGAAGLVLGLSLGAIVPFPVGVLGGAALGSLGITATGAVVGGGLGALVGGAFGAIPTGYGLGNTADELIQAGLVNVTDFM